MTRYGEADTRAKLIDPKLKAAGWGESQIEREYYFVKKHPFTAGRVYLVGEESKRREPRRTDYLLRLTETLTRAARAAEITVHDHLIIGRDGHFSFRDAGILLGEIQ